ncbi:MAG TPA: hypothetical protein VF989_21380 [Polyangiaceae bacterium]|jgi:hypothetical protein
MTSTKKDREPRSKTGVTLGDSLYSESPIVSALWIVVPVVLTAALAFLFWPG